MHITIFKVTYREKAPSNKNPALTKSMNMDIWIVATSNQLFIRSSYTETKFSKKQSSYWQKLCSLWKCCIFNLSTNRWYSSFLKKVLFFGKFVSKLKYWKRSKFPVIVTQKHTDVSNGGIFWKSLVPFCRITYALSFGFKRKSLRENRFSVLRQKPTQILP